MQQKNRFMLKSIWMRLFGLWLSLIWAMAAAGAAPAQTAVKTIYVVPGSHLDVGFTDTPGRVREERIAILDEAIRTMETDSEFHWFEEGAWAFDAWYQRYSGDERRLASARRYLRSGRLGVGATWVSPHIAAIPEGLSVLTLHLEGLERDFGYRPDVAVLNDPPSYPEALVDALAARGIRYLLIGANMFITGKLPSRLVRTPFWWESAKGDRVLTYIDPDSYTAAFTRWGIEPGCARAFEPDRFPTGPDDMATMRRAITGMLEATPSAYDAVVVEHAFDNWDLECARRLPDAISRWNASGSSPRLQLASPDVYFRHIEENYGTMLPVYQGEWGGQWDAQDWAEVPVTFWRLREAARSLSPETPRETKMAVATALDHNVGGSGCSSWGFTESQVLNNGREVTDLFRSAVRLALGEEALQAMPPELPRPSPASLPESWLSVIATDATPARIRSGSPFVGPFLKADLGEWKMAPEFGADERRLVIHTRIDRTMIPGTEDGARYVVLEVPLRARRPGLRLAQEDSPDALMGRWLRGGPPNGIVVAPNGLRIIGLQREITVNSPIVKSWTLLPDPNDSRITWLQGLVLSQSNLCQLQGGRKIVLPYSTLYPGEPAVLDVDVMLELR